MLKVHEKTAKRCIVSSLILVFIGNAIVMSMSPMNVNDIMLGRGIMAAGGLLWLWGNVSFAFGKGYGRGFGFLMGLLPIIGIIILLILPDKHKREE